MKNKTFISKLIFPLLLIIMVLTVSYLFIQTNSHDTLTEIKTRDELQLELLKTSLDEALKDVYKDIKLLSEDQTLLNFLKSGNKKNYRALCKQFLNFSIIKKTYDQVRFIDVKGNEVVRVNYDDSNPYIVESSKLQNKKERYYFKNAIKLNRNGIYISRFDLNIEHGKIEEPRKPTLRFCIPVFDDNGNKRGIVVLNYKGKKLLNFLETAYSSNKLGSYIFIDEEGFFLKTKYYKEDEFGFMFKNKNVKTFARVFPNEWKRVKEKEHGEFLTERGFFIFTTIYATSPPNPNLPHWKLISFIPNNIFYASIKKFNDKIYLIASILIGLILFGTFYFIKIENENLKQKKQLLEAEKRFRIAFYTSPDSININRLRDGFYVNVNEGFTKTTGYTEDDVRGKSTLDLGIWAHEKDRDKLVSELELNGEVNNFEAEFRIKNGETRIGLMSAKIIMLEGEPHILSVTRDITEIKRVQNKLKESERKLQALMDAAEGVIIFSLDDNYRYTAFSVQHRDAMNLIWGVDIEIGHNMLDYIRNEEDRKKAKQDFDRALKGEHFIVDEEYGEGDERIFWENRYSPIFDENNKVVGISVFVFDITDRKKAEEERYIQEKQYRSIFENSRDAFLIFDEQGTIVEANPAALELYGYSREEFIGLSGKEIVNRNYWPLFKKFVDKTSRGEEFFVTSMDIKKDGTNFYVEVKGSSFFFRGKNHLLAMVRDITERKIAEEALIASEKKFKLLTESSPFGIIIHKKGNLIYANKAAAKILEADEKVDYTGESIYNFIHKDFVEKSRKRTYQAHKTGALQPLVESKFVTLKGNVIDVEVTAVPLEYGEEGTIQVIFNDITDKKKLQAEVEKLSQVVHQSRVTIVITDLKGNIEYVNPFFEKVTGYTYKEVLGKNLRLLKSGKQDKKFYENLWATITAGRVWSGEFQNRKKDGTLYWEEATITPIRDNTGKIVNYCAIKTDITKRKAIESEVRRYREGLEKMVAERTEALKISEEKFRALAENSDDTIMRFDRKHRHLYVNPAVEKQTGINSDEFIGKTHKELGFPDDLIKIWESAIDKVFKTKRKENVEFQLPNGLWIDWDLIPEFDEKGNVRFIVAFGRDITKLKNLEIELNKALSKEKELSELKTQLISTISHEFRTPLTAIFSSIDLLEMFGETWEKARKEKQYNQMRNSINRLTQMLDEVIKLSRLERGKLSLNFEKVELEKFVDEAVNEIEHVFTDKHKLITKIKPSGAKSKIDKDITKIILQNLLTNAVKYSPAGGNVELTAEVNRNALILTVTDHGIGMSEKDTGKIFDEFYRAKKTAHIQGTGLGLSIVKNLVEQLKGKIEVKSKLGKGTTFTVTIPVRK